MSNPNLGSKSTPPDSSLPPKWVVGLVVFLPLALCLVGFVLLSLVI